MWMNISSATCSVMSCHVRFVDLIVSKESGYYKTQIINKLLLY